MVQYAYDVLQDKWMFESTATWMEEKVFPEVDDYHQYVVPCSAMPITRFDRQDGDKVYGSAVFNRWLDDEYDESIVRRLGAVDQPGPVRAGRLRQGDPRVPRSRLLLRAGASRPRPRSGRSWGRLSRGREVPRRQARLRDAAGGRLGGERRARPHGLRVVRHRADERAEAPASGHAAAGTAGADMLVGRKGDTIWKTRGRDPSGRQGDGRAERSRQLRADHGGRGQRQLREGRLERTDWNWTQDQQAVAAGASAVTGGGGTPDPGTQNPGGGTGGGGTRPGGSRPGGGGGSTSTLLSLKLGRAPKLAKAKVLTPTADAAGTFTATATVDAATAKRLGLGGRATAIGKGRLHAPRAARAR